MIRALRPAWRMPMAWSLWGCDSLRLWQSWGCDSPEVVTSWKLWFWIPFWWSFIGTECIQWRYGLTHLWVSLICCREALHICIHIAKKHILLAQQSPWNRTTQDNIFLSLNTVLNSHQHILVTGLHTFQENGHTRWSVSFFVECITAWLYGLYGYYQLFSKFDHVNLSFNWHSNLLL